MVARKSAILLCVLFLVLTNSVFASLEKLPGILPAVETQSPFNTQYAIARLKRKHPAITKDDIDFLKSVTSYAYSYYSYQGCPYTNNSECESDIAYGAVIKTITVDISRLTDDIKSLLKTKEKRSGCDFLHLNNTKLSFISPKRIQYRGDVYGKDRACWGDFKTDKGKTEGHWIGVVNLKINSAPKILRKYSKDAEVGELDFAPHFKPYVDGTAFGIFKDKTFFGKMFSDLLIEFKLSPVNWLFQLFNGDTPREFFRDIKSKINDLLISTDEKLEKGVESSLGEYYKYVDATLPLQYNYYIYPEETKFFGNLGSEKLFLLYSEITYMPRIQLPVHRIFAIEEKRIFDSWKYTTNKTVEVKRGDTLWKISEKEYGNPDLVYFIASANPKITDLDKIDYGDTLELPPYYRFVELVEDGRVIFPGDTLWASFVSKHGLEKWNSESIHIPKGSKNSHEIYPLQVLPW